MEDLERFGRDIADDLMLDALLLALRMHAPATFNGVHDRFIAMSPTKREGLPEQSRASFDARQKVLAEKLVMLRQQLKR
ncbi:MAG: hypothetical protein ACT6S0_04730 [Roseateles sp.]|uniref:hypothetical protein n=1 Tax=Roseateles sp. TaxID=1971397 RepID=UPI0040365A39